MSYQHQYVDGTRIHFPIGKVVCIGRNYAEHGVGMTKRDYLTYSRSPVEIEYMKAVKAVFDPNGIMNPGKIFAV